MRRKEEEVRRGVEGRNCNKGESNLEREKMKKKEDERGSLMGILIGNRRCCG